VSEAGDTWDQDHCRHGAGRGGAVELPAWLRVPTVVLVIGLAAFGTVGTALAVAGDFRPVVVWPAGAAVTVLLAGLVLWPGGGGDADSRNDAVPYERDGDSSRAPGWWRSPGAASVVALAVIVAVTVVNAALAAEHVETDRDPGVYNTTARWLAEHDSLLIDGASGPFADAPDLSVATPGHWLRDDGRYYVQFAHGLPVVQAMAWWLGGDGAMLRANALLGLVALLAFHALCRRLLRPWWAVVATTALGVSLVQTHFTRDAFSEIPTQALLWGGLWLLLAGLDRRRLPVLFTAGAVLGATVVMRIDSPALLVGVAAYLVVVAAMQEQRGSRSVPVVAAVVLGAALPALVGYIDVTHRSPAYYTSNRTEVLALWAVVGASLLLALTARAWTGSVMRAGSTLAEHRARLASVGAGGVVAGALLLWFVRPALGSSSDAPNDFYAQLQAGEGLAVDPAARYWHQSFTWFAWYLGPAAVALAVAGLALMVYRWVLGRQLDLLAVGLAVVPVGLLYLQEARIHGDHIWVMRRFLPAVVPFVVLAAVYATQELARLRPSQTPWMGPAAAAVAALVLLAAPLSTQAPVLRDSPQNGFLAVIDDTCEVLGPDAAVLVVGEAELAAHLPAALRSFCGAAVAHTSAAITADRVEDLAAGWAAEGRPMFVVAATPTALDAISPSVGTIAYFAHQSESLLELTLRRRPERLLTDQIQIAVAPVTVRARS